MTTSMQAVQFSQLTEALNTLFHDRRLIRGIRVDGHGSDFTFKVYHTRKDGTKGRNIILPPTRSFQQGLYTAVKEGYSRASPIIDEELEHDITGADIAAYAERGNSVILRPPTPQFSMPLVSIYNGHNIRTRPILAVGAPTISGALRITRLGNIEDALEHANARESRVLLHTGEYPIVRH